MVQRFAKTCNAHEPGSRVKIIFLNYVGTSGFWIHVTECLLRIQNFEIGPLGDFSQVFGFFGF